MQTNENPTALSKQDNKSLFSAVVLLPPWKGLGKVYLDFDTGRSRLWMCGRRSGRRSDDDGESWRKIRLIRLLDGNDFGHGKELRVRKLGEGGRGLG